MKLLFTILSSAFLFTLGAFAQTNLSAFEKECRLAGGGGFANGFDGATGGPDIWLQMSYRLSKKFSVATEFENMYYKRPGYFESIRPGGTNVRRMYDNYFSFLIKYHLPIRSKLQINAICGWSYRVLQELYEYEQSSTTGSYLAAIRSNYSNYGIPGIIELYYPISKIFQLGVRGKYNLNASNDATYAAGFQLSMKL